MMIYTTLDIDQDGFISMDEFGNSSSFLERKLYVTIFEFFFEPTRDIDAYLIQNASIQSNSFRFRRLRKPHKSIHNISVSKFRC